MGNELLKLRICANCKHYFVSGMLRDWGNGSLGYCLLIQNDEKDTIYTNNGIRKANPKAIVSKDHTCESFVSK